MNLCHVKRRHKRIKFEHKRKKFIVLYIYHLFNYKIIILQFIELHENLTNFIINAEIENSFINTEFNGETSEEKDRIQRQ